MRQDGIVAQVSGCRRTLWDEHVLAYVGMPVLGRGRGIVEGIGLDIEASGCLMEQKCLLPINPKCQR